MTDQLCNCLDNECHDSLPPGWKCRKQALTSNERVKIDADMLWQEIHRQLQSGVGVPSIALNRLHWKAALAEVEILREELAIARRQAIRPVETPQPAPKDEQGPWWTPTLEVERLMAWCSSANTITLEISTKVLEGLLHDSLLWRQDRAKQSSAVETQQPASKPMSRVTAVSIGSDGPWYVRVSVASIDDAKAVRNHLAALVTSPVETSEKTFKADCADCGLEYGTDDWLDTVLTLEQWQLIGGEAAGILCANCIVRRASRLPEVVNLNVRITFRKDFEGDRDPRDDLPALRLPVETLCDCGEFCNKSLGQPHKGKCRRVQRGLPVKTHET